MKNIIFIGSLYITITRNRIPNEMTVEARRLEHDCLPNPRLEEKENQPNRPRPIFQLSGAWVLFEGSIEINFDGLYKDYIGFIFHRN